MRVLLLHSPVGPDPTPDERDTMVQVAALDGVLASLGHRADRSACGLDLAAVREALVRNPPDLVFNLVEPLAGAGRTIAFAPALLESIGVPFTGASADALYLTSGKIVSKRMMRGAGLPVPEWVTPEGLAAGRLPPPGRLILKSVWEHASIGLDEGSLLDSPSPEELAAAFASRRGSLGGACFAERFVQGREFNLSVVETDGEPRVLPPAEMCFDDYPDRKPRLVGYRAKWDESSFEYAHTRRTFDFGPADRELLDRLADLSLDAWRLFGVEGYARVDFRVDEAGSPFVLEVNANPCLAPDAGFAAAATRGGIPFPELVERILEAGLRRSRGAAGVRPAERRSRPAAGAVFRDGLRPGDRAAVERLVRATGFFSEAEVAVALELCDAVAEKGESSGYSFVFAERGGAVVGYACYGPVPATAATWDLYWIVVHPGAQGGGLGRALGTEVERRVRALGGARLFAETSGRPQYRPTRRFYESAGYEREAVFRDFYGPGDDKCVYVRVL
jgi:D-alanine-D-alanine ligase-like ATP-grasp enzyme/ribosomal protein S18 acetylase RimI-like enzyme